MDLRITGLDCVVKLDDFLASGVNSSSYEYIQGGRNNIQEITVPTNKQGPTLIFENFANMVSDASQMEQSIQATAKTQGLLDAAWLSGLEKERL